mgnify:CR=1 FL=1
MEVQLYPQLDECFNINLAVTQGFYGIIDLVVAALLDFAHLNQSCLNSMCVQLYNKKTVG